MYLCKNVYEDIKKKIANHWYYDILSGYIEKGLHTVTTTFDEIEENIKINGTYTLIVLKLKSPILLLMFRVVN